MLGFCRQLKDEVVEADSKSGWDILFLGDSVQEVRDLF
jgi:hypothetical protein